jgi:branched-chain amino acid transport system ATP-binding protein
MSDNGALLELQHVDAGYGPFRAVFDVSLSIPQGKVLALLGSNGAGKTTIARVCSGLVRATAGSVVFDGQAVTRRRAFQFARLGVAHAPEGRSVFASLTVQENLELAFRGKGSRTELAAALERAYELFPRMGERRRQLAGTLSGGEQRMLALARVLVQPPRLLICDELSLGLAPIIVDEVYRTLATIRGAGASLLIVEQHVSHAVQIADEVAVLSKGRVTYQGTVDDVAEVTEHLLPGARNGANGA